MYFQISHHCGEYKCSQWSASAPFCVAMTTNWKFEKKKVLRLKSTSKKVYFKGGDAADVLLHFGFFLWIWLPQMTQIVITESSWHNNHHFVHFSKTKQFHTITISEGGVLLVFCNVIVIAIVCNFLKVPKVNIKEIIVSAYFSTHNLSQVSQSNS